MTDPGFWIERWEDGRIGWHVSGVNPLLARYWERLVLADSARVLVPLAGRSEDLPWLLQRGHPVDAVELAERPIREFFEQLGAKPSRQSIGGLTAWCHDRLRFFQADFFDIHADSLGRYQAVYDRAALIAMPSQRRGEYARHLNSLCAAEAEILLITLEYQAGLRPGPPFSVPPAEVEALYGGHFQISTLASEAEAERPQIEHVFRLQRRDGV